MATPAKHSQVTAGSPRARNTSPVRLENSTATIRKRWMIFSREASSAWRPGYRPNAA
jgi:hypothetical protein